MQQQPHDDLITVAAAARAVGINRSTLLRQVKSGSIRSYEGKVRLSEVVADRSSNIDLTRSHRSRGGLAAANETVASDADATPVEPGDDSTLKAKAERLIETGDVVLLSHADALKKKENYLALLRELEYDRESGSVVEIDDVVSGVAGEYALVRNRLLNIGSKVAPRAAILRSPEEVKALIDAEVALVLKELTLDGGDSGGAEATRTVRARFGKAA